MLNTAAEPGPSGCRNSFLKALLTVRQGVQTLSAWGALWVRGNLCAYSVDLWSRVVLIPVVGDERSGQFFLDPVYKLRPIALAEALLKVVEAE